MSERLVDTIRAGAIPEVVRRKACLGELPVSLQERIEILVLFASGADQESRQTAFHTLESWPPEELQQVLRDPSTPVDVLRFVAENIAPGLKELEDALLRNPSVLGQLRQWVEDTAALIAEAEASESSQGPVPPPPAIEDPNPSPQQEPQRQTTLLQRTHLMSVVQKVTAALIGTQEERMILVRDSNKLVARAVMQSPKLSEHEVENYASMKDVCEEALRLIAQNRKFVKMYVVVRALVNNPRTPIDVGLPLLKRTHDQDLKKLILNRNVSDVIRHAAQRIIRRKEEASKAKFLEKH
jgi:hypothetical protein